MFSLRGGGWKGPPYLKGLTSLLKYSSDFNMTFIKLKQVEKMIFLLFLSSINLSPFVDRNTRIFFNYNHSTETEEGMQYMWISEQGNMGIATTRLGTFTLINVKFYINILILASAWNVPNVQKIFQNGNTQVCRTKSEAASTKTRLFAIVSKPVLVGRN